MSSRVEATPEMCVYCFDVLLAQFNREDHSALPQPFDGTLTCPMFVTLNVIKRNRKQLRGCIGTLSQRPLSDLNYFVHSSAFRDQRFSPLEAHELTNLSISVSLLVDYEPGEHYLDWEVSCNRLESSKHPLLSLDSRQVDRHGVIIEFEINDRKYSATYLPDVALEQGWDQLQAITSLIKKAGYNGLPFHSFRFLSPLVSH